MTAEPREALTVAELAHELRLSEKTIRRAIASGELVAHKLCAHWRIFRPDVDAWITARSNGAQRRARTRRTVVRPRQRGSLRALEFSSTEGQG